MNEKLKERIIAAAYGDAGMLENIRIFWVRKHDAEARAIWSEYRATADKIHKMELDEYPEQSFARVKGIIDNNRKTKRNAAHWFPIQFSGQVAVMGAGLLMAVFLIIFVLRKEPKPTYEGYSQQQVEEADKQTREALAIVSRVIKVSRNTLENDVLETKIGLPIHESMQTVNQLFKEGKRNEGIN